MSQSFWSLLFVLLLSAFCLNWLWEMVQMPAYVEMARRSWMASLAPCTIATLRDVAVTLAVCGIGALASGQLCWGVTGRWNVYVTAALLGATAAVGIEWNGLASGRWSYNDRMPVVPVVGVGLWPLLQLTLLVPTAMGTATWWGRRR